MDPQTKTGPVYLRPHKAGKKWKPVWLSLVPPSSSGIGRLEIQDMGGGGPGGDHGAGLMTRHHQPHGDRKLKVVRLSELISVLRLPPNAEACPMENMSAFCVETQDRTMVFAALKDDCVEWVEKLCQNSFQRATGSAENRLHMEENQIYVTAGEASDFWVVVQRTDAALRCGLQGSYWLRVGQRALQLKEPQKMNIVREWPYELLRRYGNDKLALTIEAGRRCDSGPGTFNFETQQAKKIFSLIQSAIKLRTPSVTVGNQSPEDERVTVPSMRAHSPLPRIPDITDMASILKISAAPEETAHPGQDSAGSPERAAAQPAPITLMPLPKVPRHDTPSGDLPRGHAEAVYADPADCIKSVQPSQTTSALYVDPASVLPLLPPSSKETITSSPSSSDPQPCFIIHHPDSEYSEVYDRVSPVQNKQSKCPRKGTPAAADEPIYTEPTREKAPPRNESKPDPFAHLYAQVHKTPSSSPSSLSSTTPSFSASSSSVTASKTMDQSLDDVIYENLGII
ncbi:docking protein 3-like [Aulostomus maculatus]